MIPIKSFNLDEAVLHKFAAVEKMDKLRTVLVPKQGFTKTASTGDIDAKTMVSLFTKMLECLNMSAGEADIENVVNNFANTDTDSLNKTSRKETKERKEEIKIASKAIKDSHYQVDISKDAIVRNGSNVFMVSCYARDAYLGRYLIKRNYFYSANRESYADSTFEEIVTKTAAIKDRYYNEIIETPAILTQLRQILDGVISELKIEEDSIGTNFQRNTPI